MDTAFKYLKSFLVELGSGNKVDNAFRKVELPWEQEQFVDKTQISTLSFCHSPTPNVESSCVLEPRVQAKLPPEPPGDRRMA